MRSNYIFHLHFLALHDPIHLFRRLISDFIAIPFHSRSHKPYIFYALRILFIVFTIHPDFLVRFYVLYSIK